MLLPLTLQAALAGPIEVGRAGHAYNPSFSPDGSVVAFEVNQFEGSIDMYVVELNGADAAAPPKKVQLPGGGSAFSSSSSVASSPTWHPDGQLILEGSNPGGKIRLYYWASGRTSAVELLSPQQVGGDLSWPAVANDGKKLAFVSDSTGNGDIYIWNQTDNQVTAIMRSAFSEMAPEFDARGRVAYSRKNHGGEDLFVFEEADSKQWVGGNGDQSRPVWQGNRVVYFSNERGQQKWDIAISAGPNDKRVVARDVRLPLRASPALSPDGRWVAYGLYEADKGDRILLTALDGGRTVQVKTGLVACGEPTLTQAGGRTLLAYTALPKVGADWRQLHVMDVTSYLR